MKRSMRQTRSVQSVQSAQSVQSTECPVCFEDAACTDLEMIHPFSCGHAICVSCDRQMARRVQNRCPVCRTARVGMTQEQADPVDDSAVSDALRMIRGAANLARHHIGQNGVLFFERQNPIALNPDGSEAQDSQDSQDSQDAQEPREDDLIIALVERRSRNDRATQSRLDEQARQAAAHDLVDALRNIDRVAMVPFRQRHRLSRTDPLGRARQPQEEGALVVPPPQND